MWLAIAESNAALGDMLAFAAQRRGHQAVCVSAPERLLANLPFPPAVVVAGFESLDEAAYRRIEQLRAGHPDAVLLITSERFSSRDHSNLLALGVNDLILTPYDPFALLARAEAWCNAAAKSRPPGEALRLADLEVDLGRYFAGKNGTPVVLTKLELRLLYCLCEHHPHLVPMERLLSFGWDPEDDPDPTLVKTHISHIRHKLSAAGGVPFDIKSRQTVGYVLVTGAEGEASPAADALSTAV
jgi:DNA-binding response OmpR family regulator